MEFHTEDYVRFLSHINPGIADDYKDQMSRCRREVSGGPVVAISNDSDNPIFDGIFDFCQMYCGASIGGMLLREVRSRCSVSTEPGSEPDLRELVRRSASCEEGGGVWLLLRE